MSWARLEPQRGVDDFRPLYEWIDNNPNKLLVFNLNGTPPHQQRDDQKHEYYAYPYLNPGGASAAKDYPAMTAFLTRMKNAIIARYGVMRIFAIECYNEPNSGYTPDLDERATANKFHHDSANQMADRCIAVYDWCVANSVTFMANAWEGADTDFPGSPHRKLITALTNKGRSDVYQNWDCSFHQYIYELDPRVAPVQAQKFINFFKSYNSKGRWWNSEQGTENPNSSTTGRRLKDNPDTKGEWIVAFATVTQWAIGVRSVMWYAYREQSGDLYPTTHPKTMQVLEKLWGMRGSQLRKVVEAANGDAFVEWMDPAGVQRSWHIRAA